MINLWTMKWPSELLVWVCGYYNLNGKWKRSKAKICKAMPVLVGYSPTKQITLSLTLTTSTNAGCH